MNKIRIKELTCDNEYYYAYVGMLETHANEYYDDKFEKFFVKKEDAIDYAKSLENTVGYCWIVNKVTFSKNGNNSKYLDDSTIEDSELNECGETYTGEDITDYIIIKTYKKDNTVCEYIVAGEDSYTQFESDLFELNHQKYPKYKYEIFYIKKQFIEKLSGDFTNEFVADINKKGYRILENFDWQNDILQKKKEEHIKEINIIHIKQNNF